MITVYQNSKRESSVLVRQENGRLAPYDKVEWFRHKDTVKEMAELNLYSVGDYEEEVGAILKEYDDGA